MLDPNAITNPDYIFKIILRRRWFIIIPFCLIMIVGIYLVLTLPRIYQASTLILVEPQRVPENYVQSVVSNDIESRISTISQQILSRTNLEKIINDFNLFSGPKFDKMFPEDKLDSLRESISIDVSGSRGRRRNTDTQAFSVSYKGKDPDKVWIIANALAGYFIDENLRIREARGVGTSEFLDAELNSMRERLEGVEQKLKDYRERNMGGLPEQLESNLRILDRLQEQLGDKRESLLDAKNRLAAIENLIAQGSIGQTTPGVVETRPEYTLSLDQLKNRLQELKARYSDQHPDVIRLRKRIDELESGETSIPITAEMRQRDDIKRELKSLEIEIADTTDQINTYQKRVEDTPKREQELLSLRRDYDNINETYNSLLERKLEADLSVSMEKKQKGEQFRVIDPAKRPLKPSEPDMNKLFLLILAASFGIGGGLVFLLEYFDETFRRPEEIESMFGVSVLAVVPALKTPKSIKLKRLNQVSSVFSIMISFVLFTGFAILTFKGVEPTLAFIRRFINI
jgi:polysaccharide chain length determinant protein (PEP-CTERM system associated)